MSTLSPVRPEDAAQVDANHAVDRWLGMCGDAPGHQVCLLVRGLVADGADPDDPDGRRRLLQVEFPDLGWDSELPGDEEEQELVELSDGWMVPAGVHERMLEAVTEQLLGSDDLGLRDVARDLAGVGLVRREILNHLALVLGRRYHPEPGTDPAPDDASLAGALAAAVTEVADGEEDAGEFGLLLLRRAVEANDDERVQRIMQIKLARYEQEDDAYGASLLYSDLARMWEDAQQFDKALAAIEQSREHHDDEDHVSMVVRSAKLHIRAGRMAQAHEQLDEVRRCEPESLNVYFNVATMLVECGEVDAAREWCDAGLRVAATSTSLGWTSSYTAAELMLTRAPLDGAAPDLQLFSDVEAMIARDNPHALDALHASPSWRRHKAKHVTRARAATPGRNDPCSCGSGRKYKRCCL